MKISHNKLIYSTGIHSMIFKNKTLLATVAILGLGFVAPAQADYFKWVDEETKVSVTYPDQWVQSHNQYDGDVMTVMGPGENDHALCRINVKEDGRFAIYPERYSRNIQRIAFSRDYWDAHLAQYDNVNVHKFYDNAGLGRGFGSWAMASYTTHYGPKMDKTAIMFVAHYNNKTYMTECSAEKHAYAKWHNSFLSLVKSVDFRAEISEFPNGNYRNYYGETLKIAGPRVMDDTYH